MPMSDLCEAIAAVLHPQLVPAATGIRPPATALDPGDTDTGTDPFAEDHDRAEDPPEAYHLINEAQRTEWARVVGELTDVQKWGEDPLVHALEVARRRREQIDEDIRLLITLAREFIAPRPYEYSTLARASGLTQYLVRKSYTAEDITCIQQVTGLEPRTQAVVLERSMAS